MSDYSVKNLMEVQDASKTEGLEVRMARKHLDSSELGVSYFRYPPNHHSSGGHRHEVQEEAYLVLSGSGQIKLDDDSVELRRWDVVRVAPSVVRGFDAGPDGLELIAIGGAKPEDGDGVRVDEVWP